MTVNIQIKCVGCSMANNINVRYNDSKKDYLCNCGTRLLKVLYWNEEPPQEYRKQKLHYKAYGKIL